MLTPTQARQTVTGIWVTPIQYRMTDTRTHTTKMALIPGADDPTLYDAEELHEAVMYAEERFIEVLRDKPNWQQMPRETQHELGPHLKEIETSKRRRKEVGHGRYW